MRIANDPLGMGVGSTKFCQGNTQYWSQAVNDQDSRLDVSLKTVEADTPSQGVRLSDVQRLRGMLVDVEIPYGNRRRYGLTHFYELEIARLPFVKRLGPVAIHIYANEGHHSEPHFHVVIKGRGVASFSIVNLRRLAGDLDRRAERQIIEWAKPLQSRLKASWDAIAAGGAPLRIEA